MEIVITFLEILGAVIVVNLVGALLGALKVKYYQEKER